MSNYEIKLQMVNGKNDIDFGDDGDLICDEGLETAIKMSLFLDERADESEIPQPYRRGGYWAKEITDMQFSKLWLVVGRRTQENLNKSEEFSETCLQWLIEEGYATDVDTTSDYVSNIPSNSISKGGINLAVSISKVNDIIFSANYSDWFNTDY